MLVGDAMRISEVEDGGRRTTMELSHSKAPVLVTRRGRLTGIFFPTPEMTLPIELKRELFPILSAAIRRQLRRRRLSERTIEADFESWRKVLRAARRRR